MEIPKETTEKKEKKIPQHEIELKERPGIQDEENHIQWVERIGGPNVVLVEDAKQIAEEFRSWPRKNADKPLFIDSDGTIILNDKNIVEYFDEEGKEKADAVNSFNKKTKEYQIQKELFDKPNIYRNVIAGVFKADRKIVIDKGFGESMERWEESLNVSEKEEKKKPKKKETKEEEKKEFKEGDEVMWESQGVFQWKEPQKIIDIKEHKGKKFAFFEGSDTGIPVDELTSEKPEKKEAKKKKKKKEKPKKKEKSEKKELTLDEQIAAKQKELEKVEIKYNIYYSPAVQSLFGLYYKARFKDLKKEMKELKKGQKKKEPKGMPEEVPEKPKVKDYLNHIREIDKLFIEMALIRGKVKRKESKPEEYEKAKAKWREAFRKTLDMEGDFDPKTIDKIIIIREKEREKKKEGGPLKKAFEKVKKVVKALWNLVIKRVGKEIIYEVKKDVIKLDLKEVEARLALIKAGVKQGIGRAMLEKEQRRLEKKLKKLEKR